MAIWTERHAADVLGSLERLVFLAIGRLHVGSIGVPMVPAVLRRIEAERMKAREPHIVPLAPRAVEWLRAIGPLADRVSAEKQL